jgi:hypothetical protein
MKRPHRSSSHKLPSSWSFFRKALEFYRWHWFSLIVITGIVAIPGDIMSAFPLFNTDNFISSYLAFAAVIMNVALMWSIARYYDTGKLPSLGQAYYDGSELIVRFTLVTLALVFMMIPAAFGGILFGTSLLAAGIVNISAPEQALLGAVALVLALPSFYLLVRYSMSSVAAARDRLRPMAALRASRLLTTGYFWPVVGRLIMLGFFLLVLSVPASLITAGLAYAGLSTVALVFFQIAATLTALPIANAYMFNLYMALEKKFEEAHPRTPAEEPKDDTPDEPTPPTKSEPEAEPKPAPEPANNHIAHQVNQQRTGNPRTIDLRTVRRYQPTFGEHIGQRHQ